MQYNQYAQKAFEELCQNAPANDCSVLIHENGVLVDAGLDVLGGWTSAKLVLEGLLGGRGQVNYTHRLLDDGMQLPALELFLDAPSEAAASFCQNDRGVCGVQNGQGYALGLLFNAPKQAKAETGNVVIASSSSLLATLYDSCLPMTQAIQLLHSSGIDDIPWGWCSFPVPPMLQNESLRHAQQESLHQSTSCVNLWVRGNADVLQAVCAKFAKTPLYLHELETAHCYRNALAHSL